MDCSLPTRQLLNAKRVTRTCLMNREEATFDSSNDLSLAAGGPAMCVGRGETFQCQKFAKRANNSLSRLEIL